MNAALSRLQATATLAVLGSVVQGCTSYGGQPVPGWFSPASVAADGMSTSRFVLVVPPQVQLAVSDIGDSSKLQIGSIADQAMRTALKAMLQDRMPPADTASGPAYRGSATLTIDAVRFEHQERRLWFFWVPPLSGISKYESTIRLAFDVSLHNAQGELMWMRTYDDDSGRLVWTTPSASSTPLPEDIAKVAHEAAWRLAEQVVHSLQEGIDAEPMRRP